MITSFPTTARKTGTVKFWNAAHGYGYIRTADGHEFYVQQRNLRHLSMPLRKGDTVTFTVALTIAENSGQPRALDVMVDGYTPAAKPAHVVAEAILKAAQDEKQADRDSRARRRDQKAAQDKANREAMRALFAAPVETGDVFDALYETSDDETDAMQQAADVRAVLA